MTENPTVAPDLDGCWAAYWQKFAENLYNFNGTLMGEPQEWDFYKHLGMTSSDFKDEMMRQIQYCDLFYSLDPLPGAAESAQRLRNSGFRIIVQTSRGFGDLVEVARQQTVDWLDRHGIVYDELRLTSDKGQPDIDFAFDDAAHHVEQYVDAGAQCVVIDQPWNRHVWGARATSAIEAVDMICAWGRGL